MLDNLSKSFSSAFKNVTGQGKISEKNIEKAIEDIKSALLDADVNLRVIRRFINRVSEEAQGEKVLRSVNPSEQFIKIVNDKLVSLLGENANELNLKNPDTLSVVLMLGLQGSGKTTTTAKLAKKLKKDNRKILLVGADLARAAAVEQLKILSEQVGVDFFQTDAKKPQDVVKEALKFAKRESYNTVIIDSAGRLEIDNELMKQLKDIKKIAEPVESLFVADAMIGQNIVNTAKAFDEEIGISGVVFTKFDSDTRGGAVLSLKDITGKAVKFVGTGEKLDDLDIFHPDRMASRILGMGDVVSLVEKAEEAIKEEEAAEMTKKIMSAKFDFNDFLKQYKMVTGMGSMSQIVKMIPGMGGMTDGKCPITLTPIHYHVDPISGGAKRVDGLKSGMTDTSPFTGVPNTSSSSVLLTGNFTESADD